MKKLTPTHLVISDKLTVSVQLFQLFFTFDKMPENGPKSTYSKKTCYFGTYGAFRSFPLVQVKKFCASLLMTVTVHVLFD